MLYIVVSYILYVTRGFILRILCYTWFYLMIYMLYMVLSYVLSVEDFYPVLCKFRRPKVMFIIKQPVTCSVLPVYYLLTH
jgi:hypothetical protein